MSFSRPELIWLALALPGLVALAVRGWRARRRSVARQLADPALLPRLGAVDLVRPSRRPYATVVLAAAALGLGAAGPRWGLRAVEHRTRSLDLVLALDVSRSMLATDLEPDRLERQRLLARQLLRELPGDRLGLVAFAGRAYVLSPPTVDHSALQLYLDALDPDIVSQGGSSLSAAVRQATDLARGDEEAGGRRAVVLVTDGEALEDEAAVLEAADRAVRAGVVIHPVGVGTPEGAPIPIRQPGTNEVAGYVTDPGGEVVVSRLNEELLREVARRTGGRYVELREPGAAQALVQALGGLQRTVGGEATRVEPRERYHWFVALALALLVIEVLAERRRAADADGGLSVEAA